MNQQIATLRQYIRLKYGGNRSEFARAYGFSEKNMSRMVNSRRYYVDMTDGTLFLKTRNQQGEAK